MVTEIMGERYPSPTIKGLFTIVITIIINTIIVNIIIVFVIILSGIFLLQLLQLTESFQE